MNIIVNNLSISCELSGPRTALPVVFIHGFPFAKEMWTPQVEVLKNQFYCITYDVRGHGSSEVGDGQYSVEFFVDDLFGLLDYLKLSSCAVVGLSMGGYIALRAVERNPERIRALVLCDTRSDSDGNEGKIKRFNQVKSIKAEGMKNFTETFLHAVFYRKTFESNPQVVEKIRKLIESTSSAAVSGTLIALAARTDTTPALYNIKVPALILVGQHDALTPPSAAHAMREKIPGAELHVIRDAAHLSNLENPSEFNDFLLKFLSRIRK